ncbi:nuclear pore complex protein Nup50 [Clonorchis sinensis]|uniref:Nuclear pore complex protein Nup50 n=1 Tax=Clonorchis sinensis TaxID=79923 RepID=G7YVX0_CLOSI|nr:nuclear pore complex protein Nup50 [Clonorchis sinensis]
MWGLSALFRAILHQTFEYSENSTRLMAKRRADVELNQDNWDTELEAKETGTFQRAEPSSLTSRKILSVKSRRSVDYEKYLKELNEKFVPESPDKSSSKSDQEKPITITHPLNSNGLGSTNPVSTIFPNKPAESDLNKVTTQATTFQPCVSTSSDGGTTKPAFSFSFPPISSSTSQPLFKFGPSIPCATPFVPASNASSVTTNPTDEGIFYNVAIHTDNYLDNEEYQPPKPVVREIKEEGSVFSVKCKLFYKLDSEWKERGVGNLFIKPISDGKFQLLVRADTNLGNILLNILMTKDIPVKLQKNNLTLVCIPSPPLPLPQSKQSGDDGNPKPIPMLLRVKSEESASELLKQFDKYRGIVGVEQT